MSEEHDPVRRILLTAIAGLSFANIVKPAGASSLGKTNNSDTLVAYFSRSGNTRVLAGVIHRSLHTDIFEIEPAVAYPEDYFQTVSKAESERNSGINPPLKSLIAGVERYQTIYLGFPIWGTTIPSVIRTFLASHNLANKRIIPFITHGGYGPGDSSQMLTSLAPKSQFDAPLVMQCDQERRTTETVTSWLESIKS